jgi:uncharacterized protein
LRRRGGHDEAPAASVFVCRYCFYNCPGAFSLPRARTPWLPSFRIAPAAPGAGFAALPPTPTPMVDAMQTQCRTGDCCNRRQSVWSISHHYPPKEFAMAIMTSPVNERRHIPDRRTSSNLARHGTKRMSAIDWVAMVLLIIGGLNWGLVGLFNFDLVATLFGQMSALSRIVYVVVGLSALYSIYTASKMGRDTA